MVMHDAIKLFARNALGCGCEEEVFRKISTEDNIRIKGDILLRKRINIGNRLLVYITEPIPDGNLSKTLSAVVKYGKSERDTAGFNRLRVVIPDSLQIYTVEDAENVMKACIGSDDKMHVHIIGQSDLDQVL
ncbi:MAG TPA: hypothetical protein PK544_12025 [Spirochaetota bacterium]|nr:hypothetical protein [Spirochaetota bacterium]